jgi:hypothetical protein
MNELADDDVGVAFFLFSGGRCSSPTKESHRGPLPLY